MAAAVTALAGAAPTAAVSAWAFCGLAGGGLAGLLAAMRLRRVVTVVRIDRTHVHMRGVHPLVLAPLPAVATDGELAAAA